MGIHQETKEGARCELVPSFLSDMDEDRHATWYYATDSSSKKGSGLRFMHSPDCRPIRHCSKTIERFCGKALRIREAPEEGSLSSSSGLNAQFTKSSPLAQRLRATVSKTEDGSSTLTGAATISDALASLDTYGGCRACKTRGLVAPQSSTLWRCTIR